MKVRFVLVRPRNPLNIGASSRAMANFGFGDLAVVKPYAPVWREAKSAVGGEPVLKAARDFASIEDALGDCALVVGTTAVRERRTDRPVVSLPDLGDYMRKHHPDIRNGTARAAILFGPEKTGLSGPYLARCQFWLTIPTDPACPSMNLGQAVALCAYEWARAGGTTAPVNAGTDLPPATIEDRRRLARHAAEAFDAVRFLPFLSAAEKIKKIRQRLLHWNLRRPDVALLHGFFRFVLKDRPRAP